MTYSLQELVRHMLTTSGMTAAEVSREMGKTSGYLAVLLSDGRTPRLDSFIKIAKACGYDVRVAGWGDLELWGLGVDGGEVMALKELGSEDMEELSQTEEDMREALREQGKQDAIDSLIEYLQSLKEQ